MPDRTFIRFALLPICGSLAACSGGSGGPAESTGVTKGTNVVGKATQAACEQAAERETPACFVIDGTQAKMYGIIGPGSLNVFNALLRGYPAVKEVLMVNVPGSLDDDTNQDLGRALRGARLNTRINSDGVMESGGVDLFLAGIERVVQNGAKIGVHSWRGVDENGNVIEGRSLPRNHPDHRTHLKYYRDIEFPNYEAFYFFTLAAAPGEGMHHMTPEEIKKWKIATPIVQTVTSSGSLVSVGVNNKIGPHRVNIAQSGTVHVRADASDTQFRTRGGVNHIDGGAGEDSIRFAGRKSEYTISRRGGELTVVDSYYERNGIAVLKNVERLEFRQASDAAE